MTLRKTNLATVGLQDGTLVSYTENTSATDFSLLALPPELHMHLFKHLDIVTATCLGLTNKRFYAVLKAVHGEKPIRFYSLVDTNGNTTFTITAMPDLLREWMKPLVWGSGVYLYRFITPERLYELGTEVVVGELGPDAAPKWYGRWGFRAWRSRVRR